LRVRLGLGAGLGPGSRCPRGGGQMSNIFTHLTAYLSLVAVYLLPW